METESINEQMGKNKRPGSLPSHLYRFYIMYMFCIFSLEPLTTWLINHKMGKTIICLRGCWEHCQLCDTASGTQQA